MQQEFAIPPPEEEISLQRLALIRRIYFYVILFASYVMGIFAVDHLLRVLLSIVPGLPGQVVGSGSLPALPQIVARNAGILIVVTPIHLLHWAAVRRQAQDPAERQAALRKLYFYVSAGLSLAIAVRHTVELLQNSLLWLLRVPLTETGFIDVPWLYQILLILLHLALLRFFYSQLAADGDLGQETGRAGSVRRLFQTLVGVAGLGLMLAGAAMLLEWTLRLVLERVLDQSPIVGELWRRAFSQSIPLLVVGSALWRSNWNRWAGYIAAQPAEGQTALRRVYLYLSTVIAAVVSVVPASFLLRDLLLIVFGLQVAPDPSDLSEPLSFILTGGVLWGWHSYVLQQEAARYGDSPASETIRRLYTYLIAAVGLVVLWWGMVTLLRLLLDVLVVQQGPVLGTYRARQLANGLSMVAAGAPVWSYYWQAGHRIARRRDDVGRRERASGPRRAYLYGVALAGALLILFDLTRFIYRLLLWSFGEAIDPLGPETLDALVRSGTALVFWLGHVLALRHDLRLGAEEPLAEPTVAARRAQLEAQIRQLEAELAALRAELAQLESTSPKADAGPQ